MFGRFACSILFWCFCSLVECHFREATREMKCSDVAISMSSKIRTSTGDPYSLLRNVCYRSMIVIDYEALCLCVEETTHELYLKHYETQYFFIFAIFEINHSDIVCYTHKCTDTRQKDPPPGQLPMNFL